MHFSAATVSIHLSAQLQVVGNPGWVTAELVQDLGMEYVLCCLALGKWNSIRTVLPISKQVFKFLVVRFLNNDTILNFYNSLSLSFILVLFCSAYLQLSAFHKVGAQEVIIIKQ